MKYKHTPENTKFCKELIENLGCCYGHECTSKCLFFSTGCDPFKIVTYAKEYMEEES